jgi:uncharacterized membrane protein YqhA
MTNELEKFIKELELLQMDIDERNERIKHMKQSRLHMRIIESILVIETIVLILIAYGLIR